MKKLVSNTAGFILIIAIFVLSFIIVAQKNLTVEKVSNIIESVYQSRSSYNDEYFIKMINGSNIPSRYTKFFNNKELEKLYIKYFSEYILYANGVPNIDKPEFNELKESVDISLENYETETGLEADRSYSFKFFYDLDENMSKTAFLSKQTKKTVSLAFNKNVRDITIAVILTCIVIIIILNRDVKRIILHISSVFLSNGVGFLVLRILTNKYGQEITVNDFLLKTIKELSTKFKQAYIICFIAGFIFLIIFFLIKILYKRKDKPQIVEVNQTAVPQFITNIDQMPQNQFFNNAMNPNDSLKQFNNMGQRK